MKIYKDGDAGKGLCESCKGIVNTTYRIRDLPLSEGNQKVKGALCIVCDSCDSVIGFPQQSLHRVQEAVKGESTTLN